MVKFDNEFWVFEYDFTLEDYDGRDINVTWTYEADGDDLIDEIQEYDELHKDYPELKNLEDDDFYNFLKDHFDEIMKKYESYLQDRFESRALRDCEDNFDWSTTEHYPGEDL